MYLFFSTSGAFMYAKEGLKSCSESLSLKKTEYLYTKLKIRNYETIKYSEFIGLY